MKNTFHYTGINSTGNKIAGKITADTKQNAIEKLTQNHITILSIKKSYFSIKASKTKLTHKNKIDFTQQLQLLLQTGIPLADALSLIEKTSPFLSVRNFAVNIKEKVLSGISLSAALSDYHNYFNNVDCHIIAAGEHSGQLDFALAQLIDDFEYQRNLKNKLSKALFYPISVVIISILITIGMLLFVIPQFAAIYNNFNAQLPTLTLLLIKLSNQLLKHGLIILFFFVFFIVMLKNMLYQNTTFQKWAQTLLLTIPLYRTFLMTKEVTQWSRVLAMTLSSHIPLIDGLSIANQTIANPILFLHMQHVRENIIIGKSLHTALDHCPYFPLQAKSLIAIGENADALPMMMKKIATLYQQHFHDTLDRLSKLLEPVIMIGVASVVSGLIIAMYLPIFRMGNVV